MPKLYEVPRLSLVRVIDPEGVPPGAPEILQGQIVKFIHIDGMYSYCKDQIGNTVHLKAWQEVEIV
jgi:hypothetical protein